MKRLKIIIQLIIFSVILLICTKINAASITLSPNKSTMEEGEEFTVSVNLSGASLASLNARVSVDTSKVEYLSSSEPNNTNFNNGRILYTWTDASGGANPKTSGTLVTFTLRAKAKGTANFTISGNFYDSEENSVSLTLTGTSVNINGKETEVTPPPVTENNNTGGNEQQPPEQNVEPETPPQQNEENNNNNNNQEPPQQIPQENNSLNSNAYLSSLQVSVEGISPRFNRNTTNYYLIIDNTIDTVNVTATPEDANASVLVTGNTNLQVGVNKITITVTAQNGTTKRNYIINVTKTNDPNNANTNLENLAIEDAILTPEFNRDVLEYTTNVGSNVENVNILAVPEIEGATVNITGGNNLQFGDNIVTVTVIAKDNVSSKIYNISVYRKTEAEEIEEMALLEENNNLNNNIDNNAISNDIKNNAQKNNILLWMTFILLFAALILMLGYIIWKKRKKDNFGK